ncbi:nicotinamide riboside transporter PnuC [Sphingomonas jaspsi]|uniref:nicotinamide riboside transporter PnuC n=1 Tax=Sphingomonas jaspsi TaxID=392409 RepID=UPI0004B2B35A|nr:nicotinamide riboside transporter PnuC [Sphingomonas jaspsi]
MTIWEAIAALLGLANVWLVVRRSVWNYPFGLAMVALYFFVFWEAKLYSDALLQIFFFAIQLYGWWNWVRAPKVDDGIMVERMGNAARFNWLAVTVLASLAWGFGMHRLTDAAAPFVDATVAGFSVAAQLLQSLRRFESWALWIAVDVIAVGLYAWKGLFLTSGLYLIFLLMAVAGFVEWRRKLVA